VSHGSSSLMQVTPSLQLRLGLNPLLSLPIMKQVSSHETSIRLHIMSTSRKHVANPAWATISKRVEWLVSARLGGKKSAMAKAIGFSHTIVAKVIDGKVEPGPRLKDAIISKLHVNPVWLETGEGQPFPDSDVDRGIPVTNVLLPGSPLSNQQFI